MATINKRVTRKRTAKVIVSSDSELDTEDISSPKKKTKKMGCSLSKKDKKKEPDLASIQSKPAQNVGRTANQTRARSNEESRMRTDDIDGQTQSVPSNAETSHKSSNWRDEQLLAELKHLDRQTSLNIVKMFDEGSTIPFMCRYRRELIANLSPDEMRDIKITYNHIKNIRSRAENIVKDLGKRDLIDDQLEKEIMSAKSLDALDHLYAPFKMAGKSSLFERAKEFGLEEASQNILNGKYCVLSQLVNKNVEGIDTVDKVKDGIKNYISHVFSKDTDVLEKIQDILNRKKNGIKIETTANAKAIKASKENQKSGKSDNKKGSRSDDPSKFENYFKYQVYTDNIQSHQVLAINRAENLKFITVKVVVPDRIQFEIYKLIQTKFFGNDRRDRQRMDLLEAALNEAYTKKVKPLLSRQLRSMLTKNAEKESIEVFAKNLKQLLLLKPVKGKRILGIDPGFRNGCKIAMISEHNDVLETKTIYPHTKSQQKLIYEHQLTNLMNEYQCEIIAIGNGTACRETENWVTDLIKREVFHTKSVRYCIVNENGASIYSCSDVAKQEFPKLDVNLISAVSIARRLSDPLAELVKIEPKHLGVGMYQHDINEKCLMESLNEVVMECVSFVGVDINTASPTLLKHIAGLNVGQADKIVKYRTENGPFGSRDELKKVKSIGTKTFEQCAGFIRIDPKTVEKLKSKYNVFDSTWVHPESYSIANKIILKLNLNINDVGSESFANYFKQHQTDESIARFAKDFRVPQARVESIVEALARESRQDYRDDSDIQPLFKQGLLKMSDLKTGMLVSGAVQNVCPYGCYVDVGVERNGLIHSSQLCGKSPNIGDRVNVFIINVEIEKGRIQLRLESIV